MDSLMERYTILSSRSEFNPKTYSEEWLKLAQDFEAAGREAMSAGCYGKAMFYANVGKGYANKLSFTEVTRVQPHYRVNKGERMLPCHICGTDTKHVETEGGWSCGCGNFVVGRKNVSNP